MPTRTVPTLPTFLAGSQLTSGQLTQLTTYMAFWANRPMFKMYQSSAQSVPSGVFTQITMDTVAWDSDSGRAIASPWSFVIPAGMNGRWRFAWKVGFAVNATGVRIAALYQNGTEVVGAQADEQSVSAASRTTDVSGGTATVNCAGGDTIAVFGFQDSGGALNTDSGAIGAASVFEGSFESLANP